MPEVEPSSENAEPAAPPKRGCSSAEWVVIVLIVLILAGLAVPGGGPQDRGRQMQAVNNCRQIIIALQNYAADHGGKFPEGTTANDAFRELIKGDQLEDERVFGSPASPYQGDDEMGDPPEYAKALQEQENHWAMTKGLNASSDRDCPLVFENPITPTWPPYWDAKSVSVAKPGRIWKGGKVVVGRVDGSVNLEKLLIDDRPQATLAPGSDGKNLFERAGPHEIMDVAR